MKTKIISKLSLKVRFDDGRELCFPFLEKLGQFDIDYRDFNPHHQVKKLLRVIGIVNESKVAVSYIYENDYETSYFFFPIGERLTIEDHMEVLTPKFAQSMQHVSLILESEQAEVDLDPSALYLEIEESAHGLAYRSGDRKRRIRIEEGTSFESELLREGQDKVTVRQIDGTIVHLLIEHASGKKEEKTVTPTLLCHNYEYGGMNTRYDHEFWERFFTIRLSIPGAVQINKQ
ncbi:MAG: hypothetical protein K6B65_03445 [Bacilli bacterium]|nr:hypothetical protein [Bacilli bacterium]